jgi:hypothetical protein
VRAQLRGLSGAQGALNRAADSIEDATEEMLTVMLAAISAQTTPFVPVDTGALINSEKRSVRTQGDRIVASISYGGEGANARGTPVQEYAIYVHEGPQKNWQKPGASNLFLARGTENFIQDDLSRIMAQFKI